MRVRWLPRQPQVRAAVSPLTSGSASQLGTVPSLSQVEHADRVLVEQSGHGLRVVSITGQQPSARSRAAVNRGRCAG
ncbi:hypothetical protein [Lentzea sp. NPDC003310]|uniref:hypothetical protein n=1 Tax=Lentzea sp. NPDC003310 TaxID=3154447 RepID=UPI0033A55EFC